MAVQLQQALAVGTYIIAQRLKGRKRFPLVLMLEPLFRCNLACSGCGKIQHPAAILKQNLTPEECFAAVAECGAPVVSIPGGEPLLHPQISEHILHPRELRNLCIPSIASEIGRDSTKKTLLFSGGMNHEKAPHHRCFKFTGRWLSSLDSSFES